MQLTLALAGTKPLLQHNGRLANPLKQISGKRKKTDEDLVEMMRIEARGSAYETEDGRLGMPTIAVWRSIQQAATAFKLGRDIARGLLADDTIEPLTIGGEGYAIDDYLDRPGSIDYRSVKVGQARTMRARLRIPAEWSSTHTMELDPEVLDLRNLQPVFERAGKLVGLCDWRPRYGTFTIAVTAGS